MLGEDDSWWLLKMNLRSRPDIARASPSGSRKKRALAEVNRHGKQKFDGIIIGAPWALWKERIRNNE